MKQLSIVVTCTDRKSQRASSTLQARNLALEESTSVRLGQWLQRVNSSREPDVPLSDLYQGEAWSQVRRLFLLADTYYSLETFIASAGLGLQRPNTSHPSYSATFSPRHVDTVAQASGGGTQEWWHGLRGVAHATSLTDLPSGPTVLVLSEAYARALHNDLIRLGRERGGELLIIGGWRDIEGLRRVRADRDLRNALGGTASSLLVRMAAQWLALDPGGSIESRERLRAWDAWTAVNRKAERYDRRPTSDPDIQRFIEAALRKHPKLTATGALRQLRSAGFACEQKRFGSLFAQVRDDAA